MARYSAEYVRCLRARGHAVDTVVRPRTSFLAGTRAARRALLDAVRASRPAAVWAHAWSPWGLAAAAGLPGAPRLLVSVHGAEVLGPAASWRYRLPLRFVLRRADAVLGVSRFSAAAAVRLGAPAGRVSVVPNGVDAGRFAPGARRADLVARWGLGGKRVVLTVGGLVERKGQDLVIRAMASLHGRFPDLAYLVVGGWALAGSREEALKSLARDLGVADRVVFTGPVGEEDLPDVYRLADLFAMPGRFVREKGWVEGFGISYLEAAAAGVPSVAAAAGGAEDAVADGETGIVVPPEDAPAVAGAISRLLEDDGLRRRMGARARARVLEGFTWERSVERVEEVLRGLESS